jgi:hypothetical protein
MDTNEQENEKFSFKDTESQLETIREIFAKAKQEDNWNLDEPMLYSFYFVDEDIFELGDDETNESTGEYLLHIDKVGVYTPESLAGQNVEFQRLADEYEIESFDGWEFGEVGEEDDEEADEEE